MIDATDKLAFQRRLNKVIGQCNGILRMIGANAPCTDTLLQVSAAKNALHQLGQIILDEYVAEAVKGAIEKKDAEAFSKDFGEIVACFCQTPTGKRAQVPTGTFEERIAKVIDQCTSVGQLIRTDGKRSEILSQILLAKNALHAFGQFLLESFVSKTVAKAIEQGSAGVFSKDFTMAIASFCRMRK